LATKALPLPEDVAAPDGAWRARAGVVREVAWSAFDVPAALAAWIALALCAVEPNPFLESWYLMPSLRALDPRRKIRILRFELDGELAGLMPISRSNTYYGKPVPHLASWLHPNAFLGAPLVAAGTERAFWRAMLAWSDRNAGSGMFLHLAQMPLDGPLYKALRAVLDELGRHSELVHREERAMLCSPLAPDAYLDTALSGKKRKELRRQWARLNEAGAVAFARSRGSEGLEAWADTFLALESAGWKGREGSALAGSPNEALFREALAGAARHGKLERLTLNLDGAPIAMLASFVTPPGAFSFKTVFDERFARFSPGVLLQRENLAMLERDDVRWTDSCAAADHPMIDHLWRERRPIGALSLAIGGPLRRKLFAALVRAETRHPQPSERTSRTDSMSLLSAESRKTFAECYPEVPHKLAHSLHRHPLLEFERLAQLAEALPVESVEYNLADLPIAVEGKPNRPPLSIGEMIRQVGTAGSWCVLQNIEQDPEYKALLDELLDDVVPMVEAKTGRMMHRVGFIFVTSPGGVTPCHFDPEHNILLQVRGSKVMTQFPVNDTRYASDQAHEDYHTGGAREIPWNERLEQDGLKLALGPGEGLFVPVMAPHYVRNGDEPSISLSITWRSEWSYEEADARAFNKVLRRAGFSPARPGRWPQRNRSKALAWRTLRKLRGR
jgi:CelD/BcsL family acetyltransferase involved in cellulose biosynthesis